MVSSTDLVQIGPKMLQTQWLQLSRAIQLSSGFFLFPAWSMQPGPARCNRSVSQKLDFNPNPSYGSQFLVGKLFEVHKGYDSETIIYSSSFLC
jgi:hypothetical protein